MVHDFDFVDIRCDERSCLTGLGDRREFLILICKRASLGRMEEFFS
jgi:hypothetical protein